MAVPCTDALIAVNLNLLLSAVMLNFALPAVINIALTVPLKWLQNLSSVTTDIWFSLLMKISALFSLMTVLSLTVSFQAVRSVILEMLHKLNKKKNFVPGFVCVLHSFGRPLEWNPHIHCLLTEGGFSDDGFWRVVKYFDYTYLRKAFQTTLLNEMESRIGTSFKTTKSSIYSKDKNGFYVYAKPNLCDVDTVVKYISRYLGRPVIATSRIDSYDGDNVTLHYNRHEDNAFVERTLPVMDFIKLLIQHIPEKHFKMTRYYGLYARHREIDQSLHKAVSKSKQRILMDFNTWRKLTILSFGYDPLQCPKCNHKMEFLELYHNHERVSLEELYERTMAKYRTKCRSSGKCA